MRKLLTVLFATAFAFVGATAVNAQTPTVETIPAALGGGVVEVEGEATLIFTAGGFGDLNVRKLELDIYREGSRANQKWDYDEAIEFGVEPRDYDVETTPVSSKQPGGPKLVDIGVNKVSYNDSGVWEITFDFNNDFWKEGEYDFLTAVHFISEDGERSKVGENNFNIADADTRFFTIDVKKTQWLTLVDFSNQTIRERQTASFDGGLKLSGYVGDIVNDQEDTHWTVDYTISTDPANLDGATITTKEEGGNDVDITQLLAADKGELESEGHTIDAEEGDDFTIPLDFKVTAQNRGTYTFTISATATRGDVELGLEEEITLTVNRRPTGGSPRPIIDEDEDELDEEVEETEEEVSDVVEEFTTELADLMEMAADYDNLSDEERVELAARLVAVLAGLQAQLDEVRGTTEYNFTRDLTVGSTGEDVRALQVFLNSNGFAVATAGAGSAGNESDYFGELTRAALARYQAANGISPTAGYFGPVTRAQIAG